MGHRLQQAFDALDREDAEAHRPFRTSLVIAKETDMLSAAIFGRRQGTHPL